MIRTEITGTAVYSDLPAKTVKKEYNALLSVGLGFEDAEDAVTKAFVKGESFLPEHESVFWLGPACAEHRYGRLSEKVRKRALYAIDSGEDINAAAYEPHDREDDDDERMLMLLWGIAA
ncbi:MAG: hypothetical protein NC078_11665, partial [Ruminococcus sp.]|nr:hypothetical protein [Ruminococcus sp.]